MYKKLSILLTLGSLLAILSPQVRANNYEPGGTTLHPEIFSNPNAMLLYGAKNGQPFFVQRALSKGAFVNCFFKINGTTPLMYAAKNLDQRSTYLLLKAGAKWHYRDLHGETAFSYAYKASTDKHCSADLEPIDSLLSLAKNNALREHVEKVSPAEINNTKFLNAVCNKDIPRAGNTLISGANINACQGSALGIAIRQCDYKMFHFLCAYYQAQNIWPTQTDIWPYQTDIRNQNFLLQLIDWDDNNPFCLYLSMFKNENNGYKEVKEAMDNILFRIHSNKYSRLKTSILKRKAKILLEHFPLLGFNVDPQFSAITDLLYGEILRTTGDDWRAIQDLYDPETGELPNLNALFDKNDQV